MPQIDLVAILHITSLTVAIYTISLICSAAGTYYKLVIQHKLIAHLAILTLQRAKLRQTMIFTITLFPHIYL